MNVTDRSDLERSEITRIMIEVEAKRIADQRRAWPWRWVFTGRSTRAVVHVE